MAANYSMQLLQILVGLGIVLITIFAVAWVAKKTRKFNFTANSQIKPITVLPMGTREKLALIQVKDKEILIGITSSNIQTLHVFNAENEIEETTKSFSSRMQEIISRDNK